MSFITILTVLTLALSVDCQICSGPSSTELIQSGKITFNYSPRQTKFQCYTLIISYQVPNTGFDIALATKSLETVQTPNGLDYALLGGRGKTNNEVKVVLSINLSQNWTKIEVQYFASSRNKQFWIGKYFVDTFPFVGCGNDQNQNIVVAFHVVQNWQNSPSESKALVFITGIRTLSSSFIIKLSDTSFTPSNGKLSVRVQKDRGSEVQMIQLTYIIYRSSVDFTAYSGSQTIGRAYDYLFQGMNSLNSSNRQATYDSIFLGVSLNQKVPCVGSACNVDCLSRVACSQQLGNIVNNTCVKCKELEYFQNGKCVANCGQFSFRQPDGSCLCNKGYGQYQDACYSLCGSNAVLFNKVCTCVDGYYRFGNNCYQAPSCKQNQQLNQGKCQCKQGYVLKNGQCVLIQQCGQYSLRTDDGQCLCLNGYGKINGVCVAISQCSANQQRVNNSCVCIQGYNKVAGRCTLPNCGSNQVFNGTSCVCESGYQNTTSRCILQCNPNESFNGKVCICLQGYQNISGRCIPNCGSLQILSGYNCICKQGYQKVNNVCVNVIKCGSNQVLNGTVCVCKENYKIINSICSIMPVCQQNEVPINSKCECRNSYTRINDICLQIPNCLVNQRLDNNTCVCQDRYKRNGSGICTLSQVTCGQNQVIVKDKCECEPGYIQLGPTCVSLCGINQVFQNGVCKCKQGTYKSSNVCRACSENSIPNQAQTACQCQKGLKYNETSQKCLPQCVQNSTPMKLTDEYVCVCNEGYYSSTKSLCQKSPVCPTKSVWNQQKLVCECTTAGQYLIDQKCQPCSQNSGWNGQKCVCRSGSFLISGQCQQCPANSQYNGKSCDCNIGLYNNGQTCTKCHQSCGKCKGPNANQCQICADVSYDLGSNGICTKRQKCQRGFYLSGQSCRPCSSYCNQCTDENICSQCIDGFSLSGIELGGISGKFCFQICGDGKRFELDCDDGNLKDGDGCSSSCKVQNGWTCTGGSPVRPTTCQNIIPSRSIISPKGSVLLQGRIIYGITMTYIPPKLTQNNCLRCSDILDIRIIQSAVVPQIKVQYIQKSQYNFLVEFNFSGLLAIPPFIFTIRISQKLKDSFTEEDLKQVQTLSVDPALLAKVDEQSTLRFNQINPNQISVPNSVLNQVLP